MQFRTFLGLLFAFLVTAPTTTAVPIEDTEYSNDIVYFHDETGKLVDQRPLTPEELEMRNNYTQQSHGTEKRSGNNDIVFSDKTYASCGTSSDNPFCTYLEVIIFHRLPSRGCNSPSIGNLNQPKNACNMVGYLDGQWFYMDNCDKKKDWGSAGVGNYIGNLLTWNNQFVGECYTIAHEARAGTCSGYQGTNYVSLVRCNT